MPVIRSAAERPLDIWLLVKCKTTSTRDEGDRAVKSSDAMVCMSGNDRMHLSDRHLGDDCFALAAKPLASGTAIARTRAAKRNSNDSRRMLYQLARCALVIDRLEIEW